jgi:hypothetical protein
MKKIYAQDDDSNHRYTFSESTGSVHRAPVELIDPVPTKIGEASSLSEALSIIRENEADTGHDVKQFHIK